jgi:hypothetical protein
MYFVFICENKRMRPVEIVLSRRGGGRRMERINLKYIVSTYVNITMYPPVQLLYANKKFKKEKNTYIFLEETKEVTIYVKEAYSINTKKHKCNHSMRF